jgi:hypothetical protein
MSSLESDRIDKSSLTESDLDLHVLILYLCGFPPEAARYPLTNSWAVFLQTSPFESVSVRIQRSGTSDAFMRLESRNEVYPCGAVRVLLFRTIGQPTVRQLIEILLQRGRDRYRFTESGRGERFWYYRIMKDWEEAGILADYGIAMVKENLEIYWNENGPYFVEMVAGTFYGEDGESDDDS